MATMTRYNEKYVLNVAPGETKTIKTAGKYVDRNIEVQVGNAPSAVSPFVTSMITGNPKDSTGGYFTIPECAIKGLQYTPISTTYGTTLLSEIGVKYLVLSGNIDVALSTDTSTSGNVYTRTTGSNMSLGGYWLERTVRGAGTYGQFYTFTLYRRRGSLTYTVSSYSQNDTADKITPSVVARGHNSKEHDGVIIIGYEE